MPLCLLYLCHLYHRQQPLVYPKLNLFTFDNCSLESFPSDIPVGTPVILKKYCEIQNCNSFLLSTHLSSFDLLNFHLVVFKVILKQFVVLTIFLKILVSSATPSTVMTFYIWQYTRKNFNFKKMKPKLNLTLWPMGKGKLQGKYLRKWPI